MSTARRRFTIANKQQVEDRLDHMENIERKAEIHVHTKNLGMCPVKAQILLDTLKPHIAVVLRKGPKAIMISRI